MTERPPEDATPRAAAASSAQPATSSVTAAGGRSTRLGVWALGLQATSVLAWALVAWSSCPIWLAGAITSTLFPISIVLALMGLATDRTRAAAFTALTLTGLVALGAIHVLRARAIDHTSQVPPGA